MRFYQLKNKKNIKKILLLTGIMFFTVSFGVLAVYDSATAAQPCKTSRKTNEAMCPGGGFKLNVGIPGITKSCTYKAKTGIEYGKDGPEVKTDDRTLYCVKDFREYIISIYNLFIGVVGILAVIMIMLGGFKWLLAAGNAQKIGGAKTTIISAIIGMVLALGSYSILNFINPDIWKLRLNVADVKLADKSVVGLCGEGKATNYILFKGECEKGPRCGQKYMLMKQNEQGEDEYCSGYVVDNDKICYQNKDGSTQVTSAIHIKDGPSNYDNITWNTVGSVIASAYTCGRLYREPNPKYPEKIYYRVGTRCPINGDRPNNDDCVISDTEITEESNNTQVGYIESAKCVKAYNKDNDEPDSCK